jgi:hypothetical protein
VFGVLLMIAGAAYLASAFATLVLPRYAQLVSQVALPLEVLEAPIIFWLLIWGAKTRPTEHHLGCDLYSHHAHHHAGCLGFLHFLGSCRSRTYGTDCLVRMELVQAGNSIKEWMPHLSAWLKVAVAYSAVGRQE